MKDKYRQNLLYCAKQSLNIKLLNELNPYLSYIPIEVNDMIQEEIQNFHLSEKYSVEERDRLGPKIQSLGREIAGSILPEIKIKIVPILKKRMEEHRKMLAAEKDRFAKIEFLIDDIRHKIEKGSIEKKDFWHGADVIVTPEAIPKENLGLPHCSDIQVITHSEELAKKISWILAELRDVIPLPFDYQNNYIFYSELAQTANHAISNTEKYNEKNILKAIINRLEDINTERIQSLIDFFQKEQQSLDQIEKFLLENSSTQGSKMHSKHDNHQ